MRRARTGRSGPSPRIAGFLTATAHGRARWLSASGPPGGRTGPGCSRRSVVLDPEEVLFGQQLVQPGLVDAADDGGFLVAVTDALGQRERGGHDVEQAQREEAADPPGVVQVADAGDRDRQGDGEGDRGLHEEGRGGPGAQRSAHAPYPAQAACPAHEYGYSFPGELISERLGQRPAEASKRTS